MEKLPDITGKSGENGEYGKNLPWVWYINIQIGYQKCPLESGEYDENSETLSAMMK